MRCIATTLLLIFSYNSFSQDSLSNSTPPRDTIQLYYKRQPVLSNAFFILNKPIFKIGDNIYNANELKPIIGTNGKAFASFKAYRFAHRAGSIVSLMTLGSTVALVDAIANKKTVLLPIGAVLGTYLLSDLYFRSSRKHLNKALRIYNSN